MHNFMKGEFRHEALRHSIDFIWSRLNWINCEKILNISQCNQTFLQFEISVSINLGVCNGYYCNKYTSIKLLRFKFKLKDANTFVKIELIYV